MLMGSTPSILKILGEREIKKKYFCYNFIIMKGKFDDEAINMSATNIFVSAIKCSFSSR
jgi:hypothetical protein